MENNEEKEIVNVELTDDEKLSILIDLINEVDESLTNNESNKLSK